jgi:hypothetical protein
MKRDLRETSYPVFISFIPVNFALLFVLHAQTVDNGGNNRFGKRP